MSTFFNKPFAANGSRTTIPSETQTDGMMSFLEGWGYDYERHPLNDPLAKHLERGKMNYLFYIITEAIGELQRQGSYYWDENNAPYADGVMCYYANTTWISTVSGNGDKPGLTDKWKDLKVSGGSGSDFDPLKYYTREQIEEITGQINTRIDEFAIHEIGDIYPIARTTVIENEYVCNGDTVPILSNIGIVLASMPTDYKDAWGIKKIGTQRIQLPMISNMNDNDVPQAPIYDSVTGEWDYSNVYSTSMFSLSVGVDRTKQQYYAADITKVVGVSQASKMPGVRHIQSRFTPVIWLPIGEDRSQIPYGIYFEGTDNVGLGTNGELVVRQLRFGLYNYGSRFVSDTVTVTGVLSGMTFFDKTGAQITGVTATATVSNSDAGVVMIVTLNKNVTAATMTANGSMSIPDETGGGNPTTVTFSLTKEALV